MNWYCKIRHVLNILIIYAQVYSYQHKQIELKIVNKVQFKKKISYSRV